MLKAIASYIILFLSCCPILMAQSDGSPANLDQHQWQHRVILVFADSKENEQYQKQLKEFSGHEAGFQDRDLITLHLFSDGNSFVAGQDISRQETINLQEQFNVESSRFSVILLGKDGAEKLREEELLLTDKLFNVIDAMPMRQREMKQ